MTTTRKSTFATRNASLAMRDAWRMARKGALVFGGKARQYLASALRAAWAEIKADPVVQEVQKIIAEFRARPTTTGTRRGAARMSYGNYYTYCR
ncbi:MAG: hypothetical protein M0006_05310 [Magnetospirillum sp.]|nr:hypothetical protein [Magnetospirillum sp.]